MFHAITNTKYSLFFIAALFSSASDADAFDSSSYQRQQNASDSAFEAFDEEFAKPEKPPPVAPPAHEHETHDAAPTSKARPNTSQIEQQAKQLFATPESVEVNGFKFDLASCRLQNKNVRCEINVTSFDADRKLTIINNYYSYSSFYDNRGNQFNANSVRLGNKEKVGRNLSGKLVSGISTKLSVVFENVSSQTTAVSLLDLDAQTGNRKFKVQFRNIPLI